MVAIETDVPVSTLTVVVFLHLFHCLIKSLIVIIIMIRCMDSCMVNRLEITLAIKFTMF